MLENSSQSWLGTARARRIHFQLLADLGYRVVLAIVSLVLTAISLSKETENLLIISDILFIISASIQILTFVAGWLSVLTAAAVAGSMLRPPSFLIPTN